MMSAVSESGSLAMEVSGVPWYGRYERYRVEIDGSRRGHLRVRSGLVVPVEPGHHELSVFDGKKALYQGHGFDVNPGEITRLVLNFPDPLTNERGVPLTGWRRWWRAIWTPARQLGAPDWDMEGRGYALAGLLIVGGLGALISQRDLQSVEFGLPAVAGGAFVWWATREARSPRSG